MRKFLVILAIVMIAVTAPVLAGGSSTIVKVDEYSSAEPLVAFDLNGGKLKLSLMDRMQYGEIDHTGTLLRTLEHANPGLLQQMALEALKRGEAAGIIEPGVDYGTLSQSQIDALNEVLRRLVHDEVRPMMNVARQQLSPEVLTSVGSMLSISGRDAIALQGANLEVSMSWYSRSSNQFFAASSLNETTMCEPDTGDCGSGGVFCPGQCVAGCDPPSSNCTSIDVPGGNSIGIMPIYFGLKPNRF